MSIFDLCNLWKNLYKKEVLKKDKKKTELQTTEIRNYAVVQVK